MKAARTISQKDKNVVIIGAGPAGLTAAYQLCKASVPSTILEKDTVFGGLSRTVNYKGYLFDIGGHRFFTKVKAVEDIWREVLPKEDFLRRPRLSRIYYKKKFYHYPLQGLEALFNLGLWNSFLILMSYIQAQLRPEKEETFDQWVSNRFGKRLFKIFFEAYTEKVWGIPCTEITAEWAAQRIKDLSLLTAIKNLLPKIHNKDKTRLIRTLIEEFDYPKRGPGMMWETMADIVQGRGASILLGADVKRIYWTQGTIESIEIGMNQEKEIIHGSDFISSMPIRELVQKLDRSVPIDVLRAAESLHDRDFITVALIIDRRDLFRDNWLYIHDPGVRLGRIQNFKNWSPFMVADANKTCLGLEYFCFEGDGLWTMSDEELIELGKKELIALQLVTAAEIEEGVVVRVPKAYPVYDTGYKESLLVVREFLDNSITCSL